MAKRTITRKHLKTVTCAYIYTDGHAVLLHRESYKGIGVEFATVHERAFEVHQATGRLVVHSREALAHLMCSDWIGWKSAALENGSPKTKEAGIRVQTVFVSFLGAGETWINSAPDLISSEFTAQDEHTDAFIFSSNLDNWGTYKITEVVRATGEASA